jgi:cobalt/nickel transport system permease protein
MHMADALISPAVGGTLWAISGGLIVLCARKVKQSARDNLVPLMGILGAFVFAAQMINFSIPGTGSSGHLGGGLLLALLLGPSAALLAIASVLTVQALFFADGGLLALGCNIFNLGFIPAFIAYPLIYRTLAGAQQGTVRNRWATVLAAITALQLGALGVVLQTVLSRNSELPFASFAALMLPIHFAIGIAEGLITVAVVAVIIRTRPEILCTSRTAVQPNRMRPLLIGLAITALILGGSARWIASTQPDGLEWSIAHVTGGKELSQPKTEARPPANTGDSRPGVAGGLIALALVSLLGIALRLCSNRIANLTVRNAETTEKRA